MIRDKKKGMIHGSLSGSLGGGGAVINYYLI